MTCKVRRYKMRNEDNIGLFFQSKHKDTKKQVVENRCIITELYLSVKWRLKLKIHQKIKIATSWNRARVKLPYVYQMFKQGTLRHSCLETQKKNISTKK